MTSQDNNTNVDPLIELTSTEFINILVNGACDKIDCRKSIDNIIIENIQVSNQVALTTEFQYPYNITIKNCKFVGDFSIFEGTFKKFIIDSGTFSNVFAINNGFFLEGLTIENGEFYDDFIISSGKFSERFLIEDGKFFKKFTIQNGSFLKGIMVLGGNFLDEFKIVNGSFSESLNITGGLFNDIVILSGTIIEKIKISSGTIRYIIAYKTVSSEKLTKVSINKLYIDTSLKEVIINNDFTGEKEEKVEISEAIFVKAPNVLSIINLRLNRLNFIDHDSSGCISIKKCKINKLRLENFNNFGKIIFNSLESLKENNVKPEITILNSDLGLLNFISCFLFEFTLRVDNSKLVNVFYTDTIFPDEISTNKDTPQKKFRQLRDTYDQLQTVASKQGDKITALEFQAKSLNYYRESLKYTMKSPFFIKKWWLLSLMKWSNGYRLSSLRGIGFTLILGFVFFLAYIYAIFHTIPYGCLSNFWEFLNPTHKTDFISEVKGNDWALFLDFFSRIVIGFGIYQLVQAFRRFGKGGD